MIIAIHTKIRGRTRFHIGTLYRSPKLKEFLETELIRRADIFEVDCSVVTGNMLILYSSNYTHQKAASLIKDVLREAASSWPPGKTAGTRKHKKRHFLPMSPVKKTIKATDSVLTVSGEEQQSDPWHFMSEKEILDRFGTRRDGLTKNAVHSLLDQYGPNLLPEPYSRSGWRIFFDQINSLPVYLLASAAGVSAVTGGLLDAAIVMSVVLANSVIGYFTESKAEKTIHSLKNIVHPFAIVIRDGQENEVPVEDLVAGDILILKPGAYVAADCRILEASRLTIDESALTGESLPVQKVARSLKVENTPMADRKNMAYMGTVVTGGQGLGVVVGTGRFTEIGRLQMLLAGTTAPQTPIERQLGQMGDQLVVLCGGICGLVFFLGFLRGYGWLQMVQMAISLAAAAVPEGLPTAATINFSLGISKMKKHHVLARHLHAVETLGAVQTICMDKTGTITRNKMSVSRIYAGMCRVDVNDERFSIDGETIDVMDVAELNHIISVSVLCTETKVEASALPDEKQDLKSDRYELIGSATENALVQMAINAGLDIVAYRDEHQFASLSHRSEEQKYMSSIHVTPEGERLLSLKGSPQEVLAMCDQQMKAGEIVPLDEKEKIKIEIENQRMAGDSLRVLGFAMGYLEVDESFPESRVLVWLGIVGMEDPVRDGVKELIGQLHRAGIDTVMITGDQSSTAFSVASQIDIAGEKPLEILDSAELTSIDPDVLVALSEKVSVFSRVSPAYKLKIVQALQRAGRTVAMTGDGVNDGPALKASDIGIAMGKTGTDVAREVADVVLEQDNLEILVQAIQDGRSIYRNIRKSVHFFLATNFSEIMIMLGAMSLGIGIPLNVMQLLWINIISDIFPGLALSMEESESDVMQMKPRDPGAPIFDTEDYKRMTFESAVITGSALSAYGYGIMRYGMGPGAVSMAFQSLTIGQLLHAYSCRSETTSCFSKRRLPRNKYLDVALGGSFFFQALTMIFPPLRRLLGLKSMTLTDFAVVGASSMLPLIINESTKKVGPK